MTVNLVTVAIVLALFWDTGANVFLGLWALAIRWGAAGGEVMGRSRGNANEGASLHAMHGIDAAGVPAGGRLGRVAAGTFAKVGPPAR